MEPYTYIANVGLPDFTSGVPYNSYKIHVLHQDSQSMPRPLHAWKPTTKWKKVLSFLDWLADAGSFDPSQNIPNRFVRRPQSLYIEWKATEH